MVTEITQVLDELKNIDAKKAANTKAQKTLETALSDDAIAQLDSKLIRHSRINNLAINILVVSIITLAGLFVTAYLRIEDKITNESHILNDQLSKALEDINHRLDEEGRFNTQRIDDTKALILQNAANTKNELISEKASK